MAQQTEQVRFPCPIRHVRCLDSLAESFKVDRTCVLNATLLAFGWLTPTEQVWFIDECRHTANPKTEPATAPA